MLVARGAEAQLPEPARSREVALTLHLDERSSASCPAEDAIRARLDQYLGPARTDGPIHALVAVASADAGFVVRLEVEVDGAVSTRSFAGPQCASLVDAALLVASLHAELVTDVVVRPEITALPRERPELRVDAPGAAELASGWADPAPSELAFLLRSGPALTLGFLPEAAFGAGIEVGIQIGIVEAMIGGAWASETTARLGVDRGAAIALYEGSARVGIRLDLSPFALLAHALLGVGAMSGRGFGADHSTNGATPWVELGVGLEARVVLAEEGGVHVGASLVGDVIGAITSPRFTLFDAPVFSPSDVGARFTVGLWLRVE